MAWGHSTGKHSVTPYYNLHADFIDTLHDHGLEQIVSHKTREDNTLDLLITNNPSSCRNVIVKPGISDHEVVLASLDVNIPRINQVNRKIPLLNQSWAGVLWMYLITSTSTFHHGST